MILLFVLWQYKKDCKTIGKEKLAVSLGERLTAYFMIFILPILVAGAYVLQYYLGK